MSLKILIGAVGLICLLYITRLTYLWYTIAPDLIDDLEDDPYLNAEISKRRKRTEVDRSPYSRSKVALARGEIDLAFETASSCASEDIRCKTFMGQLYMVLADDHNITKSMEILHEVAREHGDAEAQYTLGVLYGNIFKNLTAVADFQASEALAVTYLYAASTGGHEGALMAMGYRHLHGLGVPKTCTTAALNYLEVAKKVTGIYSTGMPPAVELVRLNLIKDRKSITSSEINLFMQIASAGDTHVAAAIGKRYLLGIEGFSQNYARALQYLRIAASKSHAGALGLLGYVYALGLGVEKNLETAYNYFATAAALDDALGFNGLGYMYYIGTDNVQPDLKKAFRNFNASAYGGSADGMYNLGSVYLTGSGVEQSFRKASLWYTQALDRGHTPAAYSLALMHLNGIGSIRDCKLAVELLKKVCERGPWVTDQLHQTYDLQEKNPDAAAFLMLHLAETGHEVAQMNLAHLLDSEATHIFRDHSNTDDSAEIRKRDNKIYAQRFYEMSADLGSASSELRLGDYAYYGWGIEVTDDPSSEIPLETESGVDPDWTDTYLMEEKRQLSKRSLFREQRVSYDDALAHYRKTADMRITGEWMQTFVSRAAFNLGYMHQFGIGISQDLISAKRHYQKCLEVDPNMDPMPITIMLGIINWQAYFYDLPPLDEMQKRILDDLRFHALVLLAIMLVSLLHLRRRLV